MIILQEHGGSGLGASGARWNAGRSCWQVSRRGCRWPGVAREYAANANLLWNWRRKFKQAGGTLPAKSANVAVDFVPVGTVIEAVTSSVSKADGLMELSLPGGARITVDAKVDQQALVRVLCALKAAS